MERLTCPKYFDDGFVVEIDYEGGFKKTREPKSKRKRHSFVK